MLKLDIPFEGFHDGSLADHEETQAFESLVEYLTEQEREQDPEARLTEQEISNALWRHTNLGAGNDLIRDDYTRTFWAMLDDAVGMETGAELVKTDDGIEALSLLVPLETAQAWWAMSAIVNHIHLLEVCNVQDLDDLRHIPVAEMTERELGELMRATLKLRGEDEFPRDVLYAMLEGDVFSQAFDKGVAWDKFNADLDEARADKLAELPEDHPLRQSPPPGRCPQTLELPL